MATLSASYSAGVTSFSLTGFQPNQQVTVWVMETGGGLYVTANASGSYSGAFVNNDPPGAYTLKAQDSYGHSATASFTIPAPGKARSMEVGYAKV